MNGQRKYRSHPESADGDFYVINGGCIACGAPHTVAPNLIGWAEIGDYPRCIWKKQPETPEEIEEAIAAFDASEIECYRYAGFDAAIIKRIGARLCDQA